MLTIKHIDTNGTEALFEAENVEVVRSGDQFSDGIFLDRSPLEGGDIYLSAEQQRQVPRSFKRCIQFASARSSDDTTPMVYVMNRFGATVASYRL